MAADSASRQCEAWGTGVGRSGTGGGAMEGTEVDFSMEQICGDFGLSDMSLDYSRETKAGTSSLKMFQENYKPRSRRETLGCLSPS